MKIEKMTLIAYLEILQSEGQYWFTRAKAMQKLSISHKAFNSAVRRLAQKHKVARVQGDFYILVPPEYYAQDSLPATWFIDALMKHLNRPYYIGLLTAAALHGAAHQQPMTFQVITNVQLRPINIGQVRINFYYKKIILPNFSQPIKTTTGMAQVATPEMTAYDLVRYLDAAGQINNVATVLQELGNQLNPNVLANLLAENQVATAVAQRLGYLLEILNIGLDLLPLKNILKNKKPVMRALIAGSDAPIIERNSQWHLLINEKVEPDEL